MSKLANVENANKLRLDKRRCVLNNSILLQNLLKSNFASDKSTIISIQSHDIPLKRIFQDTKAGKNENFSISQGILYKKAKNGLLLCVTPQLLVPIAEAVHSHQGFHFNKADTNRQLSTFVYSPKLN